MPVTALGANGGAVNAPARPAARARAALRRPVVALPAPALRRPAALPPPSAAGLAGDGGAGAAPFPRSSPSAPEAGTSGRPPSPPRASATAERRDVETMGSSSRSPGGLGAPATTLADRPPDPPTFMTATGRIIAIGDVHGDLGKCIAALEIAGVLAEDERRSPVWTGGDAVVVQLGDVLDRGDNEIGVIMLLRDLDRQARAAGGAVVMLNGNHESLNVCGDFRYVTPGGFREAAAAAGLRGDRAASLDAQLRARLALYSPGGPIARELAANPTVLVINGTTVFAHGGLLPAHVTYGLARLNADVSAWMRGDRLPDGAHAPPPFLAMGDASSVMWNRSVGKERFGSAYERHHACAGAGAALDALGAARLVVGHTPQLGGANCECGGRVWRLDVGMSRGVLNAVPAVLEVVPDGGDPTGAGDAVRVLTPAQPAGCRIGPPGEAEELVRDKSGGGGFRF